MSTNQFVKDPSAVLDYKFDWKARTNGSEDPEVTDWLGSGETISSFTVVASAVTSGCVISVVNSSLTDSDTSVTVWLGGGDLYKDYLATCQIITSASPIARKDERSIKIRVLNR